MCNFEYVLITTERLKCNYCRLLYYQLCSCEA